MSSQDSWDWMDIPKEKVINRVVNNKKLKNGSIILMHTGAKHTSGALNEIIKGLKDKGYEFETVGNLVYKDNFMINHEGRQIKKDVKEEKKDDARKTQMEEKIKEKGKEKPAENIEPTFGYSELLY